jgi:uncharacterized protein (TIGR04255 family)
MKVPKKIDDKIKNSVVQIQFDSHLPSGTILGYFHKIFKNEIQFTRSKTPIIVDGKIIGIEESNPIMTSSDKIFTILLNDNSITFDIVNGYKGWDEYLHNIKKYLSPLFEKGIISKIQQIGIRYINNYENFLIYDKINAQINLDFVDGSQKGLSRFEFPKDGNYIVLNLINGAITNIDNNLEKSISVIDIDVINQNTILSVEDLLSTIDQMHDTGKSIFFSLITTEFLSTLNPLY